MNYEVSGSKYSRNLKHLFAAKPVQHPDPNTLFIIQADTNKVVVGDVLLQQNEQENP